MVSTTWSWFWEQANIKIWFDAFYTILNILPLPLRSTWSETTAFKISIRVRCDPFTWWFTNTSVQWLNEKNIGINCYDWKHHKKKHFKNISQLNQFSAFTQHILLRLCWLNWTICVNGRNHPVSIKPHLQQYCRYGFEMMTLFSIRKLNFTP